MGGLVSGGFGLVSGLFGGGLDILKIEEEKGKKPKKKVANDIDFGDDFDSEMTLFK